jgi:hypothetical protein
MHNHIEDPDVDVVTLHQLSRQFGIHVTNVRKWLLKEGFRFRFIRLEESGNQLCAALNREEAAQAINRRRKQGFRVSNS